MIYILLGPEEGDKNTYMNEILRGLEKNCPGGEVNIYFGGEKEGEQMLSSLTVPSFFSSHQTAIIKHFENENKTDSLAKAIVEYLKDNASRDGSSDMIILSYEQTPSNFPDPISQIIQIKKSKGTQKKVKKEIEEILPLFDVKYFYELDDSKKRSRIVEYARKQGFTITGQAVSELLSAVDNNMKDLEMTLDSIIYFMRSSKKRNSSIDESVIESYTSRTKGETGYSLFKAVAEKDLEHSLLILDSIYLADQRNIVSAFNILNSQFRLLEACLKMKMEGKRENEIFSEVIPFTIYPGGRRKGVLYPSQSIFRIAMARYRIEEVESIILFLSEMDEEIKSSNGTLGRAFYELILYAIIKKGGKLTTLSLKAPDVVKSF